MGIIVFLMPRIPQMYLNCIVYLYPTKEMAENGDPKGGTGFVVGVPRNGVDELCVVTNTHVVVRGQCSFMRYNSAGSSEIIEIQDFKWVRHPHADDVAAARFCPPARETIPFVNLNAFLTPEFIAEYGVGPGLEAFMVGRLVGRDGKQQNIPSVRFGHLAMMNDGVLRDDGIRQNSFLVEMWSLAGYSGSPVFIYEGTDRLPGDKEFRFFDSRLLGINWGFYRQHGKQPVFTGELDNRASTAFWSEGNSGFACVVPAWKIAELLAEEELWR